MLVAMGPTPLLVAPQLAVLPTGTAQVQLPPDTPVNVWLTLAPVTPELLWLVTVTV
ncbi:hypothetical protein D3C86_2021240 [compost metagenome]